MSDSATLSTDRTDPIDRPEPLREQLEGLKKAEKEEGQEEGGREKGAEKKAEKRERLHVLPRAAQGGLRHSSRRRR